MICALATEPEMLLGAETEIAKLRKGDPDALTAMIERYQFRLYRYLLRLTRDPATAEDLFQQTWLRVMEKLRSYDSSRSFEPWLFSVARNLTIDHLRRRRPDSLDEPTQSGRPRGDSLANSSPSALDRYLKSERITQVLTGMERLPVVYREVLTLRFEEEMKLEEIAALVRAPLSTVKSRLRRALLQLREEVES